MEDTELPTDNEVITNDEDGDLDGDRSSTEGTPTPVVHTGPSYQSQQIRKVMLMVSPRVLHPSTLQQVHRCFRAETDTEKHICLVNILIIKGVQIVALVIDGQERLCLAQISNTLLHRFSYNEIHNRRVALGITCLQCTPVQLEILRRAGAMPVSSRRCGMITRREAERLCNSFLSDQPPMKLPDDFSFDVEHHCAWGCKGRFTPSRYNSSRAKCVQCLDCGVFFSPNKFVFHSHRRQNSEASTYVQPDAANFNAWRRHLTLCKKPSDELLHAWEDVKAMFNGGTRKRYGSSPLSPPTSEPTPKKASTTSIEGIRSKESKKAKKTEKPPEETPATNIFNRRVSNPIDFPFLPTPFSTFPSLPPSLLWPYSASLFFPQTDSVTNARAQTPKYLPSSSLRTSSGAGDNKSSEFPSISAFSEVGTPGISENITHRPTSFQVLTLTNYA